LKGQVFSIDLLIAFLIFFALVGVYAAWRDSLFAKNSSPGDFQRASMKASGVAFTLLEDSGSPVGWNASTVKQVGLSFERNVVDKSRLANFLNLTYANATQLLGVAGYDFYFELRYLNGSVPLVNDSGLVANATMGNAYDNYSLQVPLRRLVLFNGAEAVVMVRLAK